MSEVIHPLSVRDFVKKYQEDDTFFDQIPEFSFIKPVAQKVKAQNCFCGLGEEMNRTTMTYNDVVQEVEAPVLSKLKALFGHDKICFAIQTQEGFSVRSY